MKSAWVLAAVGLLAAAFLLGHQAWKAPERPTDHAPRPAMERSAAAAPDEERSAAVVPVDEPTSRPAIDVRARLAKFEGDEIGRMEEEFEALVREEPEFADQLFQAFLAEGDPTKMSFLQNVIASHEHLRNSPEWQDRFMKVAEGDPSRERRITALTFIEQAESISSVHDRLYALAENGGELRLYALVTLKGLPDRRGADPKLAEIAARLAEFESDAELRGLAIRIEDNPDRAAKFLGDPDRTIRMQACQVVTSRETLEAALKAETDAEVQELIAFRLETLK